MQHVPHMEGGGPSVGAEATTADLSPDKDNLDQIPSAQPGGDFDSGQGRGGGGGGGGRKKSSFERIVEKLSPLYPHYAR